jgi:hypothetical protein
VPLCIALLIARMSAIDDVSKKLGALLVRGWCMMSQSCPDHGVCHTITYVSILHDGIYELLFVWL